jgi:hypothetical protein
VFAIAHEMDEIGVVFVRLFGNEELLFERLAETDVIENSGEIAEFDFFLIECFQRCVIVFIY